MPDLPDTTSTAQSCKRLGGPPAARQPGSFDLHIAE
jgi:hypothetical protein